jgi:hypothetical protein
MRYSADFKIFLKDVIYILKDLINELKEKRSAANEEERDYILARLSIYNEIIFNLKSQLKEYNISEKEIGLDTIEDFL